MHIDLNINFLSSDAENKFQQILEALARIEKKEQIMAGELDALTAQVTKNTDVEASAVVLIQGIAQKLADALAAAVAANTPAA
ncbi:MAG: hypothetical protein ABSF14_19745 [Terriglobia bacterium]